MGLHTSIGWYCRYQRIPFFSVVRNDSDRWDMMYVCCASTSAEGAADTLLSVSIVNGSAVTKHQYSIYHNTNRIVLIWLRGVHKNALEVSCLIWRLFCLAGLSCLTSGWSPTNVNPKFVLTQIKIHRMKLTAIKPLVYTEIITREWRSPIAEEGKSLGLTPLMMVNDDLQLLEKSHNYMVADRRWRYSLPALTKLADYTDTRNLPVASKPAIGDIWLLVSYACV